MKQQYQITGMTCSACAAHVEKAARAVPGVTEAQVNLLANQLVCQQDSAEVSAQVVAAVQKAGYGAAVPGQAGQQAEDPAKEEYRRMRGRLITSLCFMIPMMYLSMGHMLGWPLPWFLAGEAYMPVNAFTQFLLALPVLVINRAFFINGLKRLAQRAPNMDSLIAVGSGAALVYGVIVLYRMLFGLIAGDAQVVHQAGMELYFESSVMILTLITLGKFLESRAKGKTGEALRKLMALAPDTATVIRDGETLTVPLNQVRLGERVQVKPGERIPVDGLLLEGSTAVDQAAITGESIPVDKKPGDSLIAGSVNQTGAIVLEAQKVGEDTTLMQIVHLVQEASASKAPISKLADKISGIFVPVVMSIALVTLIVWLAVGKDFAFALSMAIAVLVISCPCALGLATPVAIMVGTGVGARHGILIKSAEALETAHEIDTVVLDKTGTVTEGKPRVTELLPYGQTDRQGLLRAALALEQASEHPLARAITAAGADISVPQAKNVASVPGKGLRGETAEGESLLGGTVRFLRESGVALPEAWLDSAERSHAGKTLLHFSAGERYLGAIAVADTIKATSPEAIAALRHMGIRVIMMTGDSKDAAREIARQAGVDEVLAEVLPQDKEKQVAELMAQGKKVAMVGDGINDAPALTRAHVGIAIGAGTDIAMDAADIVLVKSDLRDVATAIRLSRNVLRNIKENLFWAFFYNCAGIPLAAGVFYHWLGWQLSPMFAAAAMSFSSVFVVSNALRIRSFRPEAVHQPAAETSAVPVEISQNSKEEATMEKKMLVEGMSCNHCKMSVEKAISAVPGVSACVVDLANKTATITLREDVANEKLMEAVRNADFTPVKML